MLLGALIDAGAPVDWLRGVPARLGHPDVSLDVEPVDRAGVRCTKVTVRLADGRSEEPASSERGQVRAHAHGAAHGPHSHLGELIRAVEGAPLSDWVRERAVRAFRMLGEAEARVHGLAPEDVVLHEVGAVDALVDIVGCIEGFERLGLTTIYNRPVAVGSGWVQAAHGAMPVPAPATAVLLVGVEIRPDGPVLGEATTPTGAVLLRVLSTGAPPSSWRPVSSSWGAGGRNPDSYANALRLIVAQRAPDTAEIVMIATDIDDMSPEYLEPLRAAAMAAGALDVQIWSTHMKKGRPGFRFEALAAPSAADRVVEAVFGNSTTAGVRRWHGERIALARREAHLDAGPVRVKLLDGAGGPRAKPEYDDVVAMAGRAGRPVLEVARELQFQAFRLVGGPSAAGTEIPNPESHD